MTIATFSDLKTQVRSFFSDRSDIPTLVYDLANAELNDRLNLRLMQTETTLSVSTEDTALPADFKRPVHAYIDQNPRVVIDIADEFSQNVGHRASGEPRTAVFINGYMTVNPIPDGTYSVVLRYIAKNDDFSDNSDTNTLLTTHPALYLYASLKHAAFWAQDGEMVQAYNAALESEIERVKSQDRMARFGTGPLRVRTTSAP